MTFPIPNAALAQHIAVLGKTGSGKTSTGKLIIEHVVAEGARVCILDPIKSDWWGLTSSADGRFPGLPFNILGGPHGHAPLHATSGKVIGDLVATGALPLSIADMALFNPGGHSQFFIDFAQTLLRRMKGVVYLVMEEAHIFAPKERSGIGAETMAIHWAKMLATAGRSKGIRLVLVTQRTQSLHNALLGSCDTMIAHRLTAPADQEPVKLWLKANVEKPIMEKVSSGLSSLPTGSAWLCSGEAKLFELIAFPRIKTYDNTATPTGAGTDRQVTTAKVDLDRLRSIIGDAVKDAEQNDPKVLKARIAELEREAKKAMSISSTSNEGAKTNMANLAAAEARGHTEGRRAGFAAGHGIGFADALMHAHTIAVLGAKTAADECKRTAESIRTAGYLPRTHPNAKSDVNYANPMQTPVAQRKSASKPITAKAEPDGIQEAGRSNRPGGANGHDTLSGSQRRVMAAVGFWRSIDHDAPSREQVAAVAGYKPSAGGFNNLIGGLKTAGLLDIPRPGHVGLAEGAHFNELSTGEARDKMLSVLSGSQRRLVDAMLDGQAMTREDLAKATDYSAGSGGFNNLIGSLCTIGILEKPSPGMVEISDWAAEVLG